MRFGFAILQRLLIGAALVTAPMFTMTSAVRAAGIPVIDPVAIAQATKTVAQGVQQLTKLQEQVNQVTSLVNTVGKVGPGISGALLKDLKLDFGNQLNPLKALDGAMPRLLDALPNSKAGRAIGISTTLALNAKTSVEAGRKFAETAFFPSDQRLATIEQSSAVRSAAMRDAASAGYAIAVVQKNEVADMEPVMKGLSTKISASTDLRSDISANTAVLMAMLKQQANANIMLAQLVELESVQAIAVGR